MLYFGAMDAQEAAQQLKSHILNLLADEPVKVFLFGSRAVNRQKRASDFDIGILPYGYFRKQKLTNLRYTLENMNIPYEVDIVDFTEVSDDFKKNALTGAEIWKE